MSAITPSMPPSSASRSASARALFTPPGTAKLGCTRRPPSRAMMSWPYLRNPIALTVSAGFAPYSPTTLRTFGSQSKPSSRSGPGQLEDVHRVRLDDLAHVHQLAQQAGRPGHIGAHDLHRTPWRWPGDG